MFCFKIVKETCNSIAISSATNTSFPPPSPRDFNSTQNSAGRSQVESEVEQKQNPSHKRPLTEDSGIDVATVDLQVAKKVKTVLNSKSPLSSSTNTEAPSASKDMSDTADFEDLFVKLDNVLAAIGGQQNLLDQYAAKPFKTLTDIRHIIAIENELSRLRKLENDCYVAATSIPSSSSTIPFVASPQQYHPTPIPNVDFETDGRSLTHSMDTDNDTNFMTSPSFSTFSDPADDSWGPFSGKNSSLSGPSSPSYAMRDTPSIHNVSSPAQLVNAQASSSKYQPERMNTDEDDLEEDFEYDTSELLKLIGIEAPLPIRDEGTDANGDFYGRGRDLFEGPRASHNESVFI